MWVIPAFDLRTNVCVEALEGDAGGHVRRARLSDRTTLDVDVVVTSLGSIRNIEWAGRCPTCCGFWGVAPGCRVPRLRRGMASWLDAVFIDRGYRAGAARQSALRVSVPLHRACGIRGAQCPDRSRAESSILETSRRPTYQLPQFWSAQFGVNIKGVGVCSFGDEIVSLAARGSAGDLRFAAAYGREGSDRRSSNLNRGRCVQLLKAMIKQSCPVPTSAARL